MTVSKETKPPLSPLKRLTFFQQLETFDRDLAMICSVSSDEDANLACLRPILKLLEISGHGIPWLLGVFVAMYYYNESDAYSFQIAFNVLFALVLDLIISGLLKAIVKRPRPATNACTEMFFVVSVDHYSFPSGHSTRAATLAILAIVMLPLSLLAKYMLIVWMLAIAASRVMLGRHHVSDVIAGLFIGYLQALFVQALWIKVSNVNDVLQLAGMSFS